MEIEVNRVSQLYKADRIGGIRGHEMLHTATKDLNSIFWQVSAMISQEHHKIDFLHKVKRSMGLDLQGPQYLSNPTIEALANFVIASRLYRTGLTDFRLLKKSGILARRLLRIDSICLRQDISDLIHRAKRFQPDPVNFQQEDSLEDVPIDYKESIPEYEKMEVKKIIKD